MHKLVEVLAYLGSVLGFAATMVGIYIMTRVKKQQGNQDRGLFDRPKGSAFGGLATSGR